MTTDDIRAGYTADVAGIRDIGYGHFMAYDPATPDGDYGCVIIWKKLGLWTKFLRLIRIDKTKGSYRVVSIEHIK